MNRVLVIDKPSGMTSHDVVNRVRRSTGTRRVGHAGSLDPAATGVLVLLVGKATRLSNFFMETTKEYAGTIVLGVSTDTQDGEGRVTSERPTEGISEERVRGVLRDFTGTFEQVPPMTSALKRNGKPLYELARKGLTVEREPRSVTVERFELLEYEDPKIRFEITCSKGTYVRTIASDVGDRLGPGGHLGDLKRVRVGRFTLADAAALSEVEALGRRADTLGYSMYDSLGEWPSVLLGEADAETVMCGGSVAIDVGALGESNPSHVRLTRDGSSLLAVARVEMRDVGTRPTAHPVRVFETL